MWNPFARPHQLLILCAVVIRKQLFVRLEHIIYNWFIYQVSGPKQIFSDNAILVILTKNDTLNGITLISIPWAAINLYQRNYPKMTRIKRIDSSQIAFTTVILLRPKVNVIPFAFFPCRLRQSSTKPLFEKLNCMRRAIHLNAEAIRAVGKKANWHNINGKREKWNISRCMQPKAIKLIISKALRAALSTTKAKAATCMNAYTYTRLNVNLLNKQHYS